MTSLYRTSDHLSLPHQSDTSKFQSLRYLRVAQELQNIKTNTHNHFSMNNIQQTSSKRSSILHSN